MAQQHHHENLSQQSLPCYDNIIEHNTTITNQGTTQLRAMRNHMLQTTTPVEHAAAIIEHSYTSLKMLQ
jgi:hypothetical protein